MINVKRNKTKTKKGLLVGLLLLLLATLTTIGIVSAYFSSTILDAGQISSGTLKLEGEYTVTLNGTATTLDNIRSLNPGDVIVISGTVTNTGTETAWVREKLTVGGADAAFFDQLTFYDIALTQTELLSQTDYTDNLLTIAAGSTAVSDNRVIDGTSTAVREGEYTYIGSNTYSFSITVYFSHAATNEAQGKSFMLTIASQGLQFVNNNATEPAEAAWLAVS